MWYRFCGGDSSSTGSVEALDERVGFPEILRWFIGFRSLSATSTCIRIDAYLVHGHDIGAVRSASLLANMRVVDMLALAVRRFLEFFLTWLVRFLGD